MATYANWFDYSNTVIEPNQGLLHDAHNKALAASTSRVIFVESRNHYASCKDCKPWLLKDWAWPEYFFSSACHESNGFVHELVQNAGTIEEQSVKHLRCLVKQIKLLDEKDQTVPFNTKNEKVNLDYDWYEMTITIKQRKDGSVSIMCFGVPDTFHTKFKDALNEVKDDLQWRSDGERVIVTLMSEIVRLYDESIWAISNVIRRFEKGRSKINSNFGFMHELLRHVIHTTEVLEVTGESLSQLSLSSQDPATGPASGIQQLANTQPGGQQVVPPPTVHLNASANQGTIQASGPVLAQYQFWYRLLRNFMRRSKSNELRLKNEIDLAMNLVAQRDSAATLSISHSAQRDSAAMVTISVVTLIFLPATFVATIFGTSFFNYQQGQAWSMTGKFWIFWVVAGVLTLVVMAIYAATWYYIIKRQKKRQAERDRNGIV